MQDAACPTVTAVDAFQHAARAFTARLDAGELTADQAAVELDGLRVAYRQLPVADRQQVTDLCADLARRAAQAPAAPPAAPSASPGGLDAAFAGLGAGARPDNGLSDAFAGLGSGDDDAQMALQGLAGLTVAAPDRFYDGPADPDSLLEYFGYDSFRPGQREAVQAALDGRDSLVIAPTGLGKSLCYQLPGMASERLTVVVSPLIALISDQYRRLAEGGHPAVMLASGLGDDNNHKALAAIRDGYARMVFCSPERFASRSFIDALAEREIGLFVVDEAHCVSDWGHDFRPDYLRLRGVLKRLGNPPVMAATATATEQVADEISSRLGLREPVVVKAGFDRPNISIDVIPFEGKGSVELKFSALAAIVSQPENRPAIVYCGTRKDVDIVTERLRGMGMRSVAYHAGLDATVRADAQRRFMADDADVVVATNAFGMGVDKADVRSVVHYAIPTSVEGYYQEAGRGGRDGHPSRAVLLAARADLGRLISFNRNRSVDVAKVVAYLKRLRRVAKDGRVIMAPPSSDDDRLALAIAERSGALAMQPAGRGQLDVRLGDKLDVARARAIIQVAKDRGWAAYRAIEQFSSNDTVCRRRQLLDHFGDASPGQPNGRCCDVCDPIDWLAPLDELPAAPPAPGTKKRRAAKTLAPPVEGVDGGLLDALKAWRKETAGERPAYTVANNATLEQIAAVKPTTDDELLAIKGIGPAFITKHATAVFELVARHP